MAKDIEKNELFNATKTSHPVEIFALAQVVRHTFVELKKLGKEVSSDAYDAIELVEKWLDGTEISAEALEVAAKKAHQDEVPREKREQDRGLNWANTAAGNLAYLVLKRRDWKDGIRTVMDAGLYALASAGQNGDEVDAELKKIRTTALANSLQTKAKLNPPKSKPPRKFNRSKLIALLKKQKLPAHESVIEFDKRYGGTEIKEVGWVFGAYECLMSGAHKNPLSDDKRSGKASLIPVAYSPNDVIFFLDGNGTAWVHDTIEGELEKFATDAESMMKKIVNW